MDKELKFWEKTYHNKESSYDMFKKWIRDRGIIKSLKFGYLEQLTNINCSVRNRDYSPNWPLKDHVSFWKTDEGFKIMVGHPYWNYPKTWEQFEKNKSKHYCDYEEELNKLIDWSKNNNLKVKFYKRSESWYYPDSTIMYELTDNIYG